MVDHLDRGELMRGGWHMNYFSTVLVNVVNYFVYSYYYIIVTMIPYTGIYRYGYYYSATIIVTMFPDST